jgi:hypothetical protein
LRYRGGMNRPVVPEDLRRLGDAARDAAVCLLVKEVIHQGRSLLDGHWSSRAATSPLTTASALALSQVTAAFVSMLTPFSAAADLLSRTLALDFNGAAQVSIPAISLGSASFVGEGLAIPVRQYTTSAGPTLKPYKLATISSLTGEMLRSSNAEQLVRQVMIESVGPSLDSVLFSNAAGVPDVSPPGLLNSVTPLTAAPAGAKSEAMSDDLINLVGAISPVANKSSVVIVTHVKQATAIALRSSGQFLHAVLASNSVPEKTVIAIAANGIASAVEGSPAIDMSREGVLHMETNAAPLVLGDGTVAVPQRSLYQTDSVGLRLKWPVSWAVRDSRAIAYMENVVW